ncbi:MAG: hypothetical protein ABFE01_18640, partial [Phycisphaerales bacterium]
MQTACQTTMPENRRNRFANEAAHARLRHFGCQNGISPTPEQEFLPAMTIIMEDAHGTGDSAGFEA